MLLVILFFCPSILQYFTSFAGTLPSSRVCILLIILPCSLVPICSGLQQITSFGPILCLAYPEHSLRHIRASPCLSILRTKSWPPKCRLLHFPNFLTRILVLYISLASSCICFLFHISCVDTYLLPHTTLFGASCSRSSCQRKSTFLSAWA